ncbi:hypothetical protein CSB45_09995 [candidate division KSB3 bacterium]|uniref:ABC transporter substrate-binding protein n=1 Tax=candidate division KSB3 bacterium TaxID=2044937 RepID=A0A2G6E3V5_9BACT|nr:MAG: hypothetical protein CSB45_09995 [candidate division KSB3 bacterium]PIE29352.1 MAG: hypothetical protein CSA57_09095 [candidate division KSB3 bacterium]
MVDPIRKSVWADPEFQSKLENFTDYYKTFQEIIDNCKVYFTPQPMFFETTTEWAATLHEIYDGADAQEALDKLTNKLERTLKRAGY